MYDGYYNGLFFLQKKQIISSAKFNKSLLLSKGCAPQKGTYEVDQELGDGESFVILRPPPPGNQKITNPRGMRVSMGLTDRRKTAKNLADSRKNWNILAISRK